MNLNTQSIYLTSLGNFVNNTEELKELDVYNFENFLRVYKNTDGNYFYNILTTSVNIDKSLAPSTYYEIIVRASVPWTTISYNEYRTTSLWWLIMELNGIKNPIDYPPSGTKLKILYPQYAKFVLDKIFEKVKNS